MPISAAELRERLERLTKPGARGRLLDQGLARGMIWRDGLLPPGAPDFSLTLSPDLMGYGYGVLAQTLLLQELEGRSELTERGFLVAAEAIEAVVRRGGRTNERGFHLLVASISFHLARHSARAYCLLPPDQAELNLSPVEVALHRLMRRAIDGLRISLSRLILEPGYGFQVPNDGAKDDEGGVSTVDAEAILGQALQFPLLRSLAFFEFAMQTGDSTHIASSLRLQRRIRELAAASGYPNIWWSARLMEPLVSEIWDYSYHTRLPETLPGEVPQDDQDRWTDIRQKFIARLFAKEPSQLDLWPSQTEAARRSVDANDDLVVALPTSAGKTRIAELCILRTLASQERVVYVTPLRALSAQVEAGLRETLGPLNISVSSLYGASGVAMTDIDELRGADVVVATPEKLDFSLRQAPDVLDDVGLIVLDEGHMIGEGSREVRYEVLVQRLLRRADAADRRLVALSAVFSSDDTMEDFTAWLRSDSPGEAIQSDWRPTRRRIGILGWSRRRGTGRLNLRVGDESPFVPRWLEAEEPLGRRRNAFPQNPPELTIATAQRLCEDGHQTLVFAPERRSVESLADLCLTLNRQGHLRTMLQSLDDIQHARSIGIECLGRRHPAVRCLEVGVGVHHGRLPRQFLRAVEKLVDQGILRMIIASPTIAQGLDLSCSALVLHSLYRYGEPIPRSEFRNVIGRVGRAFVDLDGLVIFPVHGLSRRTRGKLRDFQDLHEAVEEDQLVSGLLYLVRRVLTILADRLGLSADDLSEYVLNQDASWGSEIEEDEDLVEALEDLDTAILGIIEDPETDSDDLAEALDEALQGSLWRRQQRFIEERQDLFEVTLVGRALWLWDRTSSSDRQAYYWAGVGERSGGMIRANIEELVADLVAADEALSEGDDEKAIAPLTRLAERLLSIHPFQPRQFPDEWQELLAEWIGGVSADVSREMGRSDAIGFIHDALVYRLVWALEAVRAVGLALGHAECEALQGAAPVCLSHGVPNRQAALLVRAGLSRSLAVKLVEEWPANFDDLAGLSLWLEDVQRNAGIEGVLDGEHEQRLWRRFLDGWERDIQLRWREDEMEVEVQWDGPPPGTGTPVRVGPFDSASGEAVVRRPDFSRLGLVRRDLHISQAGTVLASVGEHGRSLRVTRFGE